MANYIVDQQVSNVGKVDLSLFRNHDYIRPVSSSQTISKTPHASGDEGVWEATAEFAMKEIGSNGDFGEDDQRRDFIGREVESLDI